MGQQPAAPRPWATPSSRPCGAVRGGRHPGSLRGACRNGRLGAGRGGSHGRDPAPGAPRVSHAGGGARGSPGGGCAPEAGARAVEGGRGGVLWARWTAGSGSCGSACREAGGGALRGQSGRAGRSGGPAHGPRASFPEASAGGGGHARSPATESRLAHPEGGSRGFCAPGRTGGRPGTSLQVSPRGGDRSAPESRERARTWTGRWIRLGWVPRGSLNGDWQGHQGRELRRLG